MGRLWLYRAIPGNNKELCLDATYAFASVSYVSYITLTISLAHLRVFLGYVSVYDFETPEELLAIVPSFGAESPTYEDALQEVKMAIRRYQDTWRDREDYIDGDAYLALTPAM